MPIENRNLEPGTKLVATYKKETYRAEVIAGEAGKVLYRLEDGGAFKSPSSAGTAITSKACNGWMFWTIDTGVALEEGSATEVPAPNNETQDSTPNAPDSTQDSDSDPTYVSAGQEFMEPTPTPSFRRVPNQRGVDEGQVRLY